MNTKTTLTVLGITFVIGLLAVGIISAMGFGGGFFKKTLTSEEQTAMQVQQDAIKAAVEENDYGAWSVLMNERIALMQSQITQENFDAIVSHHEEMQEFHDAMREAKESGDYSKVEELKDQYDIEFPGKGQGIGQRKGMHRGMMQVQINQN